MSDGPDLLERTRMALFDVGEDPMLAIRTEGNVIWFSGRTPDDVAWRAGSIAKMADGGQPSMCRSCYVESCRTTLEDVMAARARCAAYLPLTEDCGVDRDPT